MKRGRAYCLDWNQNTRDTDWVIKLVIVCIASFVQADVRFGFLRLSTIKKSSHAQIGSQGAEKQQRKVSVVGGGGMK